jgi:CubicO group peptidase (beta-lactamase class C family)
MIKIKKMLVLIGINIFILGCGGTSEKTGRIITYEYETPIDGADGWQTASLAEVGLNQAVIERMMINVKKLNYGQIDSVAIVKNGYLVHEGYLNIGLPNRLHELRSLTKGVISILTGMAIDQGYIGSVDDEMMQYFNGYDSIARWDEKKNDIKIKHLLTMSSGMSCDDTSIFSPGREGNLFQSEDWVKFFLDLPLSESPGVGFSYCAASVATLSGIIQKATGELGADFARDNLMSPLNIEKYLWNQSKNGLLHPNGLFLKTRDIAKLGQLMLNGRWNGTQLLSQEWVQAASAHQHTDIDGDSLGYLWWRLKHNDIDYYYMHGKGGQTVMIIPSESMVITITASNFSSNALSQNFQLIAEGIIPALDN